MNWTPILPIPTDAPQPVTKHFKYGFPSQSWVYRAMDGQMLGLVCRFDLEDGKEVWPLTYCEKDNNRQWRWQSFPVPRPLFGLENYQIGKSIIIVEGEKCAAALQKIVPSHICVMSWCGGTAGVKSANFEFIKNEKILIWPDADFPGVKAAVEMSKVFTNYRIFNPKLEVKKGWDVYDAMFEDGWDWKLIFDFIKSDHITAEKLLEKYPDPKIEKTKTETPVKKTTKKREKEEFKGIQTDTAFWDNAPFKCFGYDRDNFYYVPKKSKQIKEINCAAHNSKTIIALSELEWLHAHFENKIGLIKWDSVYDTLFQYQHSIGIFDPSRIRGCGAWIDNNRIILHCGDHLLVDNVETKLHGIDSKFIYEANIRKEIAKNDPLDDIEASKLLDITDKLSWDLPIYSKLLAGWAVIAPICGALTWRPHIQITGSSSSGKTTVINKILQPLLGDIAENVTSNTTEAGIRQGLKSNAFPVLFDEAESDTKTSKNRLQFILELMRQASSETGASIAKGTTSGTSQKYKIRSMFCLSGISVQMDKYADTSRVTVLTLKENTAADAKLHWKNLSGIIVNTLKPDWCLSLRSRTIKHIRVLLKNIEIFSDGISQRLGAQRYGDQLGPLLAGAYLCKSSKVVDVEIAKKWINSQIWEEYESQVDEKDESKCLQYLLQYTISIRVERGCYERSIGELLQLIYKDNEVDFGNTESNPVSLKEAIDTMARYGIRLNRKMNVIYISNQHTLLKKCFNNTAWSTNWGKILKRIKDAESTIPMRFHGTLTRATSVPIPPAIASAGE